MPLMGLTKNAKRDGVQTFARANRLPPEIRGAEIEYLDLREWFSFQLSRLAQFREALDQAKAEGKHADAVEFGNKMSGIQNEITYAREQVRNAGKRSFAEAVAFVAARMLAPEARKAIWDEAELLIGRGECEINSSPEQKRAIKKRKKRY